MDDLSAIGRDVYGDLLNLCIWNKSNAGMGSLYRSKHELIFVYRVGQAPHFNAVELGKHGRNRTNVWDYASVNTVAGSRREDLKLHPTVKPIALVADAIQDVTRRGDLVLDVFSGSGTTLVGAERTGRREKAPSQAALILAGVGESLSIRISGEAVSSSHGAAKPRETGPVSRSIAILSSRTREHFRRHCQTNWVGPIEPTIKVIRLRVDASRSRRWLCPV